MNPETIKEDLEKILEKLDRLERMIEKSNEPFEYPGDNTPQPYSCSKCGMVFAGTTSYYCTQNDCPTFVKVT